MAAAERGEADAAPVKRPARERGVAPGTLEVVSGVMSRDGAVRLAAGAEALLRNRAAWAKGRHG